MSRSEASELFGLERGEWLAAILGNLDQSVFGELAYPAIERKAAHLFGAFLFVDFLNRNNALMRDGQPVINDIGLAALVLLVAESAPAQKEFERALLKERQREGIALAKQRGAYRGRKKSLSDSEIARLRQRAAAGEKKTTLARED